MKTEARSNLSDYYATIKLNPVRHDITDPERMRVHELKRRNLLEYCLKLPVAVWRGSKVLEFGPASGQNAAVLARWGARLTFVEPLPYLLDELKQNFAAWSLEDRIDSINVDVVETFATSKRFDAVFAEGFIQCLDNPPAGIRKLCSFLNEEGFLVISAVELAGTFIEYVKKVYLELAIQRLAITGAPQRLEAARKLFQGPFSNINHSRGFDSWALDVLLNPLYRPAHFMELPPVLEALPDDVQLYSSWPNYVNDDDLVWHKNIKTGTFLRKQTLNGYYARYPHFLHSIPQKGELPLFAPKDGRAIADAIRKCAREIDKVFDREATPKSVAASLASLERRYRRFPEGAQGAAVLASAVRLFGSIERAKTIEHYARAWRMCGVLSSAWGSPGQYLVFHRSGLFVDC